jgi:hypothetical protein
MKKEINEFNNISKREYEASINTQKKTTDVNILLNRVRVSKKIELKKRLIFLSLLLLCVIFIGIISLI